MNDSQKDRNLDRIRCLSVIRKVDIPLIQNHRLTVHMSVTERTILITNIPRLRIGFGHPECLLLQVFEERSMALRGW